MSYPTECRPGVKWAMFGYKVWEDLTPEEQQEAREAEARWNQPTTNPASWLDPQPRVS